MTLKQPTVFIDKTSFFKTENKIGVYFETEKTTTHIAGAAWCPLCFGIAIAANSSLTEHVETISTEGVESINSYLIGRLAAFGKSVKQVEIPGRIESLPTFDGQGAFPEQDFRGIGDMYGIDSLIVIHLPMQGVFRSYSTYVPASDPMGAVIGEVYTVDLLTNKVIQFEAIEVKINVTGEWEEPPFFPGVTASYYAAIETAKDRIHAVFFL